MNLPDLLAHRILKQQQLERSESRPAIILSEIGIIVGVFVMILSVSIVVGFKEEIRNKLTGVTAHIQIGPFSQSSNHDLSPVYFPQEWQESIDQIEEVKHTQRYILKPGLLKMEDQLQGILIKGIGTEHDTLFLHNALVEGRLIDFSSNDHQAVVSKMLADRLGLKLNDSFLIYFLQEKSKARKYYVVGIYETNLVENDKIMLYSNITQLQELNEWKRDEISGLEVLLHRFDDLNQANDAIYFKLLDLSGAKAPSVYPNTVVELNKSLFDWLDVLDINVWVILVLMLSVSLFTVTSGLIIIILEKTPMIGVLKALGASNTTVRKAFLFVALRIVSKGVLYGGGIALLFCLVQSSFRLIPLDPNYYYINAVPVSLSPWIFIGVAVGTLVASTLALIIPTYIITNISPNKSIRFD